jgi:hypothetical protein
MATGPITRIVLRRSDGRVEIIGRAGHINPHAAARNFAAHGKVVTVRHEMMGAGVRTATVAIHNMR